MKKIFAFLLVMMLIVSMAVPVFAVTPKLEIDMPEIPEIKVDIKLPDSFWDKWFAEHPIQLPEVTEPTVTELDTPVISTAKYVHKTPYYGMSKRLEIQWNEIEGAEYYEVLITRADGETITYTTTDNRVYDKEAACPKVYIEETSTWTAATVKVRAVCGDIVGDWSEAKKIGCDMLH